MKSEQLKKYFEDYQIATQNFNKNSIIKIKNLHKKFKNICAFQTRNIPKPPFARWTQNQGIVLLAKGSTTSIIVFVGLTLVATVL